MASTITKERFIMKKKLKLLIYLKHTGRKIRIILFSLSFFIFQSASPMAEWTIVSYAQPNLNHLYQAMLSDIQAMKKVATSPLVNILIQFCQPVRSNNGIRYQIKQGQSINLGSVPMGLHPEQEIVDMMQWAKTNFPAKKYMLLLSGDGNGTLDDQRKLIKDPRGVLYNSGAKTFLSNPALTSAITKVNNLLGQQLDILSFDDCFMGGAEVVYQVRGLVQVMTGSETTEPGIGYNYNQFLSAVVQNPTGIDARAMGQLVVTAYQNMYSRTKSTTLAAIDVTQIDQIKSDIDAVVQQLAQLKTMQLNAAKSLIAYASNKVIFFANPDYVDLNSFYTTLLQKSRNIRQTASMAFSKSLLSFESVLQTAQTNISNAIIASYASQNLAGAKGLSIYWPIKSVDPVYSNCLFAQDSPAWVNFIKNN